MELEIKTERNYNFISGADYRGVKVSIRDNGKLRHITYYTRERNEEGLITYVIKNINGREDRVDWQHFFIDEIPIEYKEIVEALKVIHKKTDWSLN